MHLDISIDCNDGIYRVVFSGKPGKAPLVLDGGRVQNLTRLIEAMIEAECAVDDLKFEPVKQIGG